jgi:hypothetical protein
VNAAERAAALTVRCGLPGCDQPPGEPCVSTVDGKFQRDNPHYNRMVRGQAETSGSHRPLMPGGESTSAMLRRVQAALAASQADLTRTERERDEAVRRAADLEQVREELKQLRRLTDGYLEDIRHLESGQDAVIDSLRSQRDLARAEVATASKEVRLLRAARQWVVAPDGGRDCVRCEQEIRRGEAYELLPGVDELAHIRCPNPITEGAPTMTTTNPGGEGGS